MEEVWWLWTEQGLARRHVTSGIDMGHGCSPWYTMLRVVDDPKVAAKLLISDPQPQMGKEYPGNMQRCAWTAEADEGWSCVSKRNYEPFACAHQERKSCSGQVLLVVPAQAGRTVRERRARRNTWVYVCHCPLVEERNLLLGSVC